MRSEEMTGGGGTGRDLFRRLGRPAQQGVMMGQPMAPLQYAQPANAQLQPWQQTKENWGFGPKPQPAGPGAPPGGIGLPLPAPVNLDQGVAPPPGKGGMGGLLGA